MTRDDDYPRAETELKNLLARHPESAQANALLGAIALSKKDVSGARQLFERALTTDPASAEAATGLVILDLNEKNSVAARTRIEDFVAKSGNTPVSLLIAARMYGLSNDMVHVEDVLKRALKADASNPELYQRLGQVYASQHRLDDAKRQYTEIVRLEPRSIAATTMLGWLSFAQNDMAEAEHWWEKTIQIDSRSAAAANNLAWLYAQRNVNLDTALTLAQTAKAAYPTSAKANDTLGFVYYRKGLDTQAIYYAQQAIDLDPANPVFHYHLGLAYAQKGQDANARRALQHALDLKVNFDGAEDARRVLKTLIF
jgi:Tfp pilus assembly protein PilF